MLIYFIFKTFLIFTEIIFRFLKKTHNDAVCIIFSDFNKKQLNTLLTILYPVSY